MSRQANYYLKRISDDLNEPRVITVTDQSTFCSAFGRRELLHAALSVPVALAMGFQRAEAADGPSRIHAHQYMITSLVFLRDGSSLLSTTHYGDAKRWTIPGGALMGSVFNNKSATQPAEAGHLLYFLGDGKSFITDGSITEVGGSIKLWSYPTPILLKTMTGHTRRITDVRTSHNGSVLYSGSEDGFIKCWSMPSGTLLRSLDNMSEDVTSLAESADGNVLAAGGNRGTIRFWATSGWSVTGELTTAAMICGIAALPDRTTFAAVASDGKIFHCASAGGRLIRTIDIGGWIRAFDLAPDGTPVLGMADGALRTCSLDSGQAGRALDSIGSGISVVRFSPDGSQLAIGTEDGAITIYSWPGLKMTAQLFDPAANDTSTKGLSYRVTDRISGRAVTYTLPCGSPVPPGATCVCNCVPGQHEAPVERPSISGPNRPSRIPTPGPRFPSPSPLPYPSPGGGTTREPCNARPLGPNEICTCNCIPGR